MRKLQRFFELTCALRPFDVECGIKFWRVRTQDYQSLVKKALDIRPKFIESTHSEHEQKICFSWQNMFLILME